MNGLNVLFEKGIGLDTLMLANVLKALFKTVCVCLVDGFNGLSTKQTPLYADKELIHPLVFRV